MFQNSHLFNGKVVLITGSSGGIGAQIALGFAREGASGIVIHGRNEEALKNVKKQVEKAGQCKVKVHICTGDFTKDDVRQKLINETVKEFGRLDVLVNNIGINMPGSISDGPLDAFDKIFDVNLRSTVALTQLAIPHLIKTAGNVINISAALVYKPLPRLGYYGMSKAALDYFTRCLAIDVGPKGVRVNGITVGYVPGTDFEHGFPNMSSEQQKQADEHIRQLHPLRRLATIEEVVDATLFMASEKAKFTTGHNFKVEGGITYS